MKKSFILLIALMMPLFLFGQSYASLWKKVEEAERKDLPKTAYEVLQRIVKKAEKEKAYGQLLKAELQSAQAMAMVAPDSLQPAMERMQQRSEEIEDEVLKTVYQTVIYRVDQSNYSISLQAKEPELTPELCEKLARVKDASYKPMVIEGDDASIFDHDLLHVVGYELYDYEEMYVYYQKAGNRRAACITAAKAFPYSSIEKLDELISEYGDLQECGELAMRRYEKIPRENKAERLAYISDARKKWGRWSRMMNTFRNEEREMTNPEFHISWSRSVQQPQQSQKVSLTDIRNVSSVTMTIYQVNAKGDISYTPEYKNGYEKIKPLLGGVVSEQTRTYTGKTSWEHFDDEMTLEGLPTGVYMIEVQSNPSTEIVRKLYFVTDVFLMSEGQPDKEGVRLVAVSATTGQPIANAHLRIWDYVSYNKYKEHFVDVDEKGETIFKPEDWNNRLMVFGYTDKDDACPMLDSRNQYSYYGHVSLIKRTCIYTDRAIYRPGQRVFVSALVYQVENGTEQTVCAQEPIRFTLRDANHKVVKEVNAATDEYGVAAAEFTLPSSGLTGRFTIQANNQNHYIRVEEYKRPTFRVEFPEVKQAYAAGDTLTVKGNAISFAGVPVQGATVKYKVLRRTAYWWSSYSRYWNTATIGYSSDGTEIYSAEVKTDDNGQFDVTMPLTMPETSYPMFYHFVVDADVTDSAGETHNGQLSLPLGNRKQTLSVDLEEKILVDNKPKATFHLLNAAGKDLDAQVKYRIDNGQWQTVKTQKSIIVGEGLKSGKHTLEATCEGDSIERSFVLFSLDDTSPATETDDWFWTSGSVFPRDGKPVTVQVGSSDEDVHIVYSIFAGDKVIERGTSDKCNGLLNMKITYEEEYGNGLLLTFAWVKNGHCYSHKTHIQRALPDKQLQLKWATFRNRLKPGQQEEWILTVNGPDGKPADAQLMATLYDQSLDMLQSHRWSLIPYIDVPLPDNSWKYATYRNMLELVRNPWSYLTVSDLKFSTFDKEIYPSAYYRSFHRYTRGAVMRESGMMLEDAMAPASEPEVMMMSKSNAKMAEAADEEVAATGSTSEAEGDNVQMRENLNETAFFYPQLTTDEKGNVAMKFTLPESLTTWRFMGLVHTKDMCYGSISGEAVAQKHVMIQPNVPRFLRDGDQGSISARIFNISEKNLTGKALLKLIDPETDAIVFEQSQNVTMKAGETTAVTFSYTPDDAHSLLVCQMSVSGKDFSDGEQHYLPILPSTERVTVTVPITQHHAGTQTIDLAALIPADARNGKLTFEYTNNPAWLMIQALPTVGTAIDDNAISQAASYYANSLGKYIIDQNPKAKTAFDLWKQEPDEASLTSQLEKNQELKDIVLNETPWVLDAEDETSQRHRLADFFDTNLMQARLASNISKLNKLQRGDGSWSWWPDMPGSFYMTVAVSEMLVRLNDMIGDQTETEQMLSSAFTFMGQEIVEEVKELKKWAKEGHEVTFPSFKALQWLYLATLDGRELPSDVQAANDYLLKLLKKDIKSQSIYEKALTAVILSKPDPQRALEYAQSLKEYTVFKEEMGRYYDTPRAGYSWYDYKIPTQTVAIEALQRLTPDDRQTIEEMQRWLLQEKRTQAWDTPINSVNAVYAFLQGGSLELSAQQSAVKVDGKPLDLPEATAAIGYVKTPVAVGSRELAVEKLAEGTSWGAVYAQFTQQTTNIADSGSGITVKREFITSGTDDKAQSSKLKVQSKVGDRIKVRITITADRDYDFVQVLDKRAACLEPVRQLSGWHSGSYCTPKDYSTNYYFDCLSKGTHVIENEYFIDRAGTYETGSCVVECAYAPEFRAVTKSQTLTITK